MTVETALGKDSVISLFQMEPAVPGSEWAACGGYGAGTRIYAALSYSHTIPERRYLRDEEVYPLPIRKSGKLVTAAGHRIAHRLSPTA